MWVSSLITATAVVSGLVAGQIEPEVGSKPGGLVVAVTSSSGLGLTVTTELRNFLIVRAVEAWQIQTFFEPVPAAPPQTFQVALDWSPPGVLVRISDGQELMVERPLSVDDMETAKLMLWLLVRSTIERALIRPGVPEVPVSVEETPPIPPASTATSTEVKTATAAETPALPAEETTQSEVAPVLTSSGTKNDGFFDVFTGIFTNPLSLGEGRALSMALMVNGAIDTASGVSGGATLQTFVRLSPMFSVGAELGYREEGKREVELYHVPLSFFGTGHFFDDLDLDLGLMATVDFKFVKSSSAVGDQTTSRLNFLAGVYAGPYARYRVPVYESGRGSALAFTADAGVLFGINRGSYQTLGGNISDSLVQIRLSTGVEWTWP